MTTNEKQEWLEQTMADWQEGQTVAVAHAIADLYERGDQTLIDEMMADLKTKMEQLEKSERQSVQ